MRLLSIVCLVIALWVQAPTALAQSVSSMKERQTWASSQTLVRGAMKIEVDATASKPAQVLWLFFERTPHGRLRFIAKEDITGPTTLTFLVQDAVSMALSGEDVSAPAAPWMLGYYLFAQPMEPGMLLSWVMGLPGHDFQIDAKPAFVEQNKGRATRIEQAGWRVDYDTWTQAPEGALSVPSTFTVTGDGVAMRVALAKIETYLTPPPEYSEFKIM
jgi:hypothetical protein